MNTRLQKTNSSPGRRLSCCGLGLAALLAGCSSVMPAKTETYECEGGRGFSVSVASHDRVRVDVAGMSFPLSREPHAGEGETHVCSVLILWRDGKSARMTMDDVDAFRNCRRVP